MPHFFYGISKGWKGGFSGDNVTNYVTRMGKDSFRTNSRLTTKFVEKNPQHKVFLYGWEFFLVNKPDL